MLTETGPVLVATKMRKGGSWEMGSPRRYDIALKGLLRTVLVMRSKDSPWGACVSFVFHCALHILPPNLLTPSEVGRAGRARPDFTDG